MKRFLLICFVLFAISDFASGQNKPNNWSDDQLIQPSVLAKKIVNNEKLPVIFCVGPGSVIPHSIHTGEAGKPEGLNNFKKTLGALNKKDEIVIYCGCCPFAHCPNVRPAIDELKREGFTNYHLLNLPQNINTDWIAKGYPVTRDNE